MTQGQSPEFQTTNEMTAEPRIQGVCKDCGNGTLNNDLNPAFEYSDSPLLPDGFLVCLRCGSGHLDILTF